METVYFGAGLLGQCVAERVREQAEGRRADRAWDAAFRELVDSVDGRVASRFDEAWRLFVEFMHARGYRRHKRGEWRRRRTAPMTTDLATADESRPPAPASPPDAAPPAPRKKTKVFGRRMDVAALHALVGRLEKPGTEKHEQCYAKIRADVESMALELAGGLDAPPAVDALANAAALSWCEWTLLALNDHGGQGRTIAQAEYASRVADRAHRRFVRSVKALAEVRRTEPKSINVMNVYADFRRPPRR